MMSGNITCHYTSNPAEVICNGTLFTEPEAHLTYLDEWFWIYIGIYVVLVLFAGVMSGLTIGLLSLDIMSLHVLEEAGSPTEQKYARRILPIVKRHHLLLVTLLLANAAAVESMPLFLDRVSSPLIAILVSVTAVLLLESKVFPQALCSRYGLAIGACMVPLVYFLMVILLPVAFPIAKLLDCLLGTDHATFFRRAELGALVGLHSAGDDVDDPHRLSKDEVMIIKGALDLKGKVVDDAKVPLDKVDMVDVNSTLDKELLEKIINYVHSRVPLYDKSTHNVVGVLLVKGLVGFDVTTPVPMRSLLNNRRYTRKPIFTTEVTPLYDMLNEFQTGKSHMAFVKQSQVIEEETHDLITVQAPLEDKLVGIITLEDVIEELLQEEIVDETDVYVDVAKRVQVARAISRISTQISRTSTVSSAPDSSRRDSTPRPGKKNRHPIDGACAEIGETSGMPSGSVQDGGHTAPVVGPPGETRDTAPLV